MKPYRYIVSLAIACIFAGSQAYAQAYHTPVAHPHPHGHHHGYGAGCCTETTVTEEYCPVPGPQATKQQQGYSNNYQPHTSIIFPPATVINNNNVLADKTVQSVLPQRYYALEERVVRLEKRVGRIDNRTKKILRAIQERNMQRNAAPAG